MIDIDSNEYLSRLQNFNEQTGYVTLSADVRNNQNVLLIAKGERLNNKHTDLLIQHKLQKSLDSYIGIEPLLTPKLLKTQIEELLEQHQDIKAVISYVAIQPTLLPMLMALHNNPLIYKKLTILAIALPQIFHRSLLNALLSAALATYNNHPKPDIYRLFVISLTENFGYLYLSKELSEKIIPEVQTWKDYLVHPIIGEKILKAVTGLPPSIATAVKHHHERLDGTGFPEMLSGTDISPLVMVTGLIDELTQLKFSCKDGSPINLAESLILLQFRRAHFDDTLFSGLQSLIAKAGIVKPAPIKDIDSKSFAKLQLEYYAQCLVFCDIIARVVETCSLGTEIKHINRIHILCNGFLKSLFESGMLSLPMKRLMEECAKSNDLDLLSDMIEINHAHKGILNRIDEIIHIIEFTTKSLSNHKQFNNHPSSVGLLSCLEYLNHIRIQQCTPASWQQMIQNIHQEDQDLSSILKSIQTAAVDQFRIKH